jgi:hypothetical protein
MMTDLVINRPAANVSYYTPAQSPPSGTALEGTEDGQLPKLFTPLKIRGVQFQNRLFVSTIPLFSSSSAEDLFELAGGTYVSVLLS